MLNKVQDFISRQFGDNAHLQNPVKHGDFHSIADLLPYRSYNNIDEIYENTGSIGFILECIPLVGADDKTVASITSMVKHDIPDGGSVQFINIASSKVGALLDSWAVERKKTGGIYDKLADNRLAYLKKFIHEPFFSSKNTPRGFVIRDYKVIIAASLPQDVANKYGKERLLSLRSTMETTLNNIGMTCHNLDPEKFIVVLDEIINPNLDIYPAKLKYYPGMPINKQIASPETKIEVRPQELSFNEGEFEVRSFSVRHFPDMWSQWESTSLIGDFNDNMLQIPCPFITMFSFTVQNNEKSKTKAALKAGRATQQADTGITKYVPELIGQQRDWSFVKGKLKDGQKLVKGFYQVTVFAPRGKGDAIESTVKELYGAHGWTLVRDRYMQLQSFMACLPFTLSEGLAKDLDKCGRLKTMVSWTCANVAPLQGEWKGMDKPYLMFIGRRGQPMFWNPFQNSGGNYNVAVIGKSGSGKSVFMQDLVASMRGAGGRVVVIDDGHSFEHSCKLQGGQFIEFTDKNKLCVNPFSIIDEDSFNNSPDYKTDVVILVNRMVRQMCRALGVTDDIENAFIERAINEAWESEGRAANITTVQNALMGNKDKRAKDLGVTLLPFTKTGTFGAYFEGTANITLTNPLMVFELAELKTRKHLQGIIMMLLMFIVTEEMRKDRTVNTSLVIDEAWDLLSGASSGEFIEGVARRARKYSGNIVTGTQSMNDYYKNPAATAAIENTDWYCFLSQKEESISQIKKSARVELSNEQEKIMKSLQVVENRFSEVMIKGPGVCVVGRLILDKFSMALYSSTGRNYAQIQDLLAKGLSIEEATQIVADEMTRRAA